MMRKIYIGFLLLGIALISFSCKKTEVQPDLLTQEVTVIDTYLDGSPNYVYYHSTGIRFEVITFGTGIPPHAGQNVNYTYTCNKLGGTTVLDSGTVTKNQATVAPDGLRLGLAYLPAGSVFNIYVPSTFGYGTTGTAKIPAYATLVYHVKINSVSLSAAEQTQLQTDTTAIRKYLNDNKITQFTVAPNGIFYNIDTLPTNPKPIHILDQTSFNYTDAFVSTGKVFDSGSTTGQIMTYIDGLKFGLPLLPIGGSRGTFYIPSVYAYGSSGTSGIPANSNLIFKVTVP